MQQRTAMKKILVVDDDTDILLLLKAKLSATGYNVTTTTSCTEGLNVFYTSLPDLVLLDINVGSEDGREMCRSIKQQADYEHIPVILISANPEALKLYADYGATAAVDKPFELNHLLDLITKHLN